MAAVKEKGSDNVNTAANTWASQVAVEKVGHCIAVGGGWSSDLWTSIRSCSRADGWCVAGVQLFAAWYQYACPKRHLGPVLRMMNRKPHLRTDQQVDTIYAALQRVRPHPLFVCYTSLS